MMLKSEPTELATMGPEIWAAAVAALGAVLAACVPLVHSAWRARRGPARATPDQVLLPSRVRLVDRTNEVSTILRHLQRGEFLIAIEGSLGTGKSAIAAEVAHRLVPRVGPPDGASHSSKRYRWLAWIDARNECPSVADVANQLSLLTGDQGIATASEEDKEAVLRSFLARHPSVLVIDNVRLSASAAEEFTRFMRTLPSGSIALVSSNTPGRLNAPRIIVEELQVQFMRELLLREARRLDAQNILEADINTLTQLYQVIGGNPRAIELLVLACARRHATLDELVEQLRSGEGPVIDELFSAVWDSITEADRLVLVVCSYLNGEALLEQFEAALEIADHELHQRIERLWSDGLLTRREQHGNAYYTLPPMVCGYILKRTPNDVVRQFRLNIARDLVGKYQEAWEDAAGSVPRIPATRQLVLELKDEQEFELCLDLFEGSLDILFTLGLFDDRIRLGWIAFEAAESLGDNDRASLALSVVSSTHSLRGEYAQADRAIEMGMEVARSTGSTREVARQVRCKAYNVFRSGGAETALELVQDTYEMAVNAGDLNNAVDILALRSAALWHLSRFEECGETVDLFLHHCQTIPWERAKAYPIREKAELAIINGSFRDAELLIQESREIAQKYRDERQLVRIALSEARLHLFKGRPLQAWRSAVTVEAQARQLGLTGERAEGEAIVVRARTAAFNPLRWRAGSVRPAPRFTEMTIGGD